MGTCHGDFDQAVHKGENSIAANMLTREWLSE